MENSEQPQSSEQQTRQPSVPPFVSHKSRVFLFIILGIFVIFIGYIFLIGFPENTKCGEVLTCHGIPLSKQCLGYKTTFAFIDCAKTGTQTSTPIISPNALDPTVNWKTYTNTKFNFSFQYPSEWKTNEYDNGNRVVAVDNHSHSFSVSFSINSPSEYVSDPEKIIKNYLSYYVSSTAQFLTGGKITTTESTEVDGFKATKYIIQESNPKLAGGNFTRAWIFVPNNSRITFINEDPYEESYVQIMDQILSTFKFTLDSPIGGDQNQLNNQCTIDTDCTLYNSDPSIAQCSPESACPNFSSAKAIAVNSNSLTQFRKNLPVTNCQMLPVCDDSVTQQNKHFTAKCIKNICQKVSI